MLFKHYKNRFTKKLASSVQTAKAEPVFKDEYKYFEDILEDEKEQARATGLAEGREAGLAEGRATGLAEGKNAGSLFDANQFVCYI